MKARAIEGLDPRKPLRGNAAKLVQVRLDELLSLAGAALEPAASGAQHDMRIAAKRLRYALEIVGPCFGDGSEAKAARRAAKDLQGVLGEIHDCDVLLPRVAGIESLATLLRERRERLLSDFHGLWRQEESRGTWAALASAL